MLCSSCRDILSAKSEVISVDGDRKFKYHDNLQAFKTEAEAGCQLCLMGWYQLSDEVRRKAYEDTTPIFYTINEWSRKGGSYELAGGVETDDDTVYFHVEFVRSQDQIPLPQDLRQTSVVGVREPSLDLVNKWINDCRTSHQDCVQLAPLPLRKFLRILDIGTLNGPKTIRLAEAREVPMDADYVTLSHCWGICEVLKLTTDNYESMREEIALDDLPKTFRDAIDITRKLGCRFLWIDSLCILQNSAEDWSSQAAIMGEIYQGGLCNIAATAARDGHDGLLMYLQRNPAFMERLHVYISDMGQLSFDGIDADEVGAYDSIYPREESEWTGMAPGYYDCYDSTIWWREVSDSPLLRRAWVVQERLLAPRVVHFSTYQIFWECNTLRACELYTTGLLRDGEPEPAPKSRDIITGDSYPETWASLEDWNGIGPCPKILRSWCNIVEAYTLGQLTFESDKLVAIAGLQNIYATRIKAPYLAGLWGFHLPRQLLWTILRPVERPKMYRAPSWSWASVNGRVEYSTFVGTDDLITKRLMNVMRIAEQGKTDSVQGLQVKARLIPCSLSFVPDAFYEAGRYNPLVRGLESAAVVMPDTTELDDSGKGTLPGQFFCVPVAVICEVATPTYPDVAGLILQPTESKGTFRRFGAFRTDKEVGRDGDSHGDAHMHLTNSESSQPGRVFLMDVEDEIAEVEERFYESYESRLEKKGFGNFVFTII